MVSQRIVLAVALLLAFTFGVSGFASDEVTAEKGKMTASDMIMSNASLPMPGKCAPCSKGHTGMAACSIVCSGTMLPLPVAGELPVAVGDMTYHQRPDRHVSGSVISPDPYLPKAIVLI